MSIFSKVPDFYKVRTNKFNLSEEILTTAEFGNIYPVVSSMMLPNSYQKKSPSVAITTAPMFAPIYSGIKVSFAAFAVPMRILHSQFMEWFTNPEETEIMPPHIHEDRFIKILQDAGGTHTLAGDFDAPVLQAYRGYLDPNPKQAQEGIITIQDFLAYHLVWQEYFRNEQLQNPSDINADITLQNYDDFVDDPSAEAEFFLNHRKCNYAKDYFTSALPTPQNGTNTFLSVLRTFEAPVIGVSSDDLDPREHVLGFDRLNISADNRTVDGWLAIEREQLPSTDLDWSQKHTFSKLYADLSNAAQGISVSDFRSLFAVQSFMEQWLVGGQRPDEYTLSFYGTKIPDYRLQRPEFLGVQNVYIAPQQVVAHDYGELGSLGAFGQVISNGRSFRYYAFEPTVFLMVMYIKPKSLYCQGLKREFRLSDQFNYPIPLFQHLGEEEILNEELFYTGNIAQDSATFGYQSRFAYWRSSRDRVRGDFLTSLTDWHLARIFKELPVLNSDFIQVTAGTSSIINDADTLNRVFNYNGKAADHFWCSIYVDTPVKLPLRYHSKPMLIG